MIDGLIKKKKKKRKRPLHVMTEAAASQGVPRTHNHHLKLGRGRKGLYLESWGRGIS